MKYAAELIGLISLAAIFGGVLIGRLSPVVFPAITSEAKHNPW